MNREKRQKMERELWENGYGVISIKRHKEIKEFKKFCFKKQKTIQIIQRKMEIYFIWNTLKKLKKVKGEFAECGIYKGGCSRILCEKGKTREKHLFDTFNGLPYNPKNKSHLKKGDFTANIKEVQKNLKKYKKVYIYKGLFEKNKQKVKNKKFAFTLIDFDLYKSTKEALKFFYKRTNPKGIILIHDYNLLPDIKIAVDEFMKNKPEILLEINDSQAYIQKDSESK